MVTMEKMTMLRNVRVVDLTRVLSGPFCTRILADLGAEVIKVETGKGDATRDLPPYKGEYSHYFTQFNVGKKSVGLNLRRPEGVELIKRLVAVSDVVIENYRPGVLTKMGLGYPVLKKIKPDIILCSISGFGQTGPEVRRLAFTDNIQAFSGMDYISGKMIGPDADPPGFPYSFGDTYASLNAAVAILAALYQRVFTGEGRAIDIAMLDCVLAANDSTLQKFIFSNGSLDCPGIAFRPPIRAKNGHMAVALAWHFERVVQAISRPDLLNDERFKTMEARHQWENFRQFIQIVREWAREKTLEEVANIFEKYEISYSKVNSMAEVVDSPVVHERNMLIKTDLPDYGPVLVVNTPFKFSEKACQPQGPPPRLGEHNREIFGGLLRLSEGEMDALIQEGILIQG